MVHTRLKEAGYGWKRIAVAGLAALLLLCAAPLTRAEETADAPLSAALTLPAGHEDAAERLSDGDVATYASFNRGDKVEIALTDGGAQIYIVWYDLPDSSSVTFYDADGAELSVTALDEELLYVSVAVPSGAASAALTATSAYTLSDVAVYESLPETLLLPERVPEQTDVMLAAAHTGDESICFGGLLPILAGEKGRSVVVVYLSAGSRAAKEQAMLSLRACGVNIQPIFADLTYRLFAEDISYAPFIWREDSALIALTAAIRRAKPDVLITHDPAGEDGDVMHAYTAQVASDAVSEAMHDRKVARESYLAYGTWQVKRVYQHTSTGDGAITIPVDTRLPSFDGLTAREISQTCLDGYLDLLMYHKSAAEAPYYLMTEAAQDAPAADPMLDLAIDPMPTPEPTFTPEPVAETEEPAVESQPDAGSDDVPAIVSQAAFAAKAAELITAHRAALLIAGGLLSAFFILLTILRRTGHKAAKIIWSLLPLLIVCAAAFGLPYVSERMDEQAAAAVTPAPTSVPTPTPTSEPTPTPEPAETSETETESGIDASWFCEPGEEESYTFDAENGCGSYKSSTLSVEFERFDIVGDDNKPVRYYVMHLRMRGGNEYRTAFGSYRQNGRDPDEPWLMARRIKAVVAITGDNMVHSDMEKKGAIIRNGILYLDHSYEDSMVLTPDGMGMYIVPAATGMGQAILESGIQNAFSFGPTLIHNGEMNPDMTRHRVRGRNPRVGLGYIEPGHLVIIVVEGRVSKYSYGVDVQTFANMFAAEGCTEAYNLDGGASASLLFMGEYVNKRAAKQQRDLPDLLTWGYSELVPSEDDPLINLPYYAGTA